MEVSSVPEIPLDIINGSVVEYKKSFLIIGGLEQYEKQGVEINNINRGMWGALRTKLRLLRSVYTLAILLSILYPKKKSLPAKKFH
jgi:hypothetical protein